MSLGQGAKLVPGQIAFRTTRTGRIPQLQPLIEAGLPPAPYIEHGSYETGQPPIMRYGRDPYRGLFGVEESQMGYMIRARGRELAVESWKEAGQLAFRVARRAKAPAHVSHATGAPIAVIHPSGKVVPAAGPAAASGLGDALTSWACDEERLAASWRQRLDEGISTGAQAALLGGALAGLISGFLGRPVLGAVVGGASSWAAYAIWTAPVSTAE